MPPDRADRRSQRRKANPARSSIPTGPSIDEAHEIRYFRRHREDDPDERSPGREFLRACDPAVRAKFAAVLVAVAKAPPRRFAGGGYWEAMHAAGGGVSRPEPALGGLARHRQVGVAVANLREVGGQRGGVGMRAGEQWCGQVFLVGLGQWFQRDRWPARDPE